MQGSQTNRNKAFRDPFADFGFHSRGSFSSVFDRDPFDDPFFSQPFGSLFGPSSGGLFGSRGFFDDDLFSHQHGGFIEQSSEGLQRGQRGLVIEEVSDDDDREASKSKIQISSNEPIVEHPDDGDFQVNRRTRKNEDQQSRGGAQKGNQNVFSQSYSYSSVSYGEPGGPYYTATSSRRTGPNGILEEQHEERDTRSGKEAKKVLRGLGDKGHSVTCKRNGEGKEEYFETLHNLTEEQKNNFDQTWRHRAEKSLPGWRKNTVSMLDLEHKGHSRKNRAALLTSGSNSLKHSGKESPSQRWPWSK